MSKHHSRLHLDALDARDLPSATAVDLTAAGSSGEVNGVIFRQDDSQQTGSPPSFVRIEGAIVGGAVREGYNTDARPLQFNESPSPQRTHSLRVGDLPRVFANGGYYRSFLLDVQQDRLLNLLAPDGLVSLDELRLFTSTANTLTNYNTGTDKLAGRTAIWDLDQGGNSWVKLNSRLNTGARTTDMLMLVPESVFAGTTDNTYLYLYSKFGEHNGVRGGYMDWSAGRTSGTGSVSGSVIDANAGVGIADQVVYVDFNNNGTREASELSTYTNASGQYTFSGLPASTDPQSVYHLRADFTGTTWTPANNDPIDVYVHPGDIFTGINFYATGHVAGTGSVAGAVIDNNALSAVADLIVYVDANNDGVRQDDEVYTYTDGNGQYLFSALPASSDPAHVYHLRTDLTGTDWQAVSDDPMDVHLNEGDALTGVNFYVVGRINPN